jgi:hypothetical protein
MWRLALSSAFGGILTCVIPHLAGLPNVTEALLVVRPSWDASSPNNLAKWVTGLWVPCWKH